MRNTFISLHLLIALCSATSTRAQKAYDLIRYQTTVYGNKTTLQLEDSYLLASKVIIRSQFGNQVFSPSANEQGAKGNLRFDTVQSSVLYPRLSIKNE